jgi:hypothetical protein
VPVLTVAFVGVVLVVPEASDRGEKYLVGVGQGLRVRLAKGTVRQWDRARTKVFWSRNVGD